LCFPNDFDYFDFDYLDCPEKKNSILSKKVNELFVDRNVNVVSLPLNSNSTAKSGGASAKNKLSALDLHRLCHQSKSRVILSHFLQPLGEIFVTLKGNKKMS
jgi:hypothetical protein